LWIWIHILISLLFLIHFFFQSCCCCFVVVVVVLVVVVVVNQKSHLTPDLKNPNLVFFFFFGALVVVFGCFGSFCYAAGRNKCFEKKFILIFVYYSLPSLLSLSLSFLSLFSLSLSL